MKHYADAIEVLAKTTDYRALLYEVAKKNPAAIITAHERKFGLLLDQKIKNMAESGMSKLQCIKHYRNETGSSLYDAKEAVERICNFPARNEGGL